MDTEVDTRDTCAEKRPHEDTEGGRPQAKGRGLGGTNPPAPSYWTFSLQNCEKINVCILSHPG